MRNFLSHYIVTVINLLKHKIYNVLDVLRNNDLIWKIDENKIIKQVKNNYSIDENDFANCEFVNQNVNQKIFQLSKEEKTNEIRFSIIARLLKIWISNK